MAHEPTKHERGRNQEDCDNNETGDSMEGDEGESQATPSLDGTDEGEGKVTAEDNTVRCPCGVNEDDGLMVLCGSCQVWQHAVCYCLLKEDDVPDLHICVACSKRGRGTCTDSSLLPLNQTRLQNLCLWRRTLHACTELTRILPSGLARRLGVTVSAAQGIIERLEHEGFIRPAGKSKRLGRTVIKEKIVDEAVPKYLTISARQNKNTTSKKKILSNRDHKAMQLSKPLQSTNGVDSLAQKTSHLNITAAGKSHVPDKRLVDPPKPALARKQIPKGVLTEVENCEVRRSPRILAKRVRSAVDETQEFEVSCSQDTTQQQDELALEEGRARKRRKASIASHAIMV